MTLLVNEIQIHRDLRDSLVLFAADRRITIEGKAPKFMKKVFRVPYLNCGVGYYGLAQVNRQEYFSSWLPNFITNASDCTSVREFAGKLHRELSNTVNKDLLSKYPSGLHVCGYNSSSYPELWHICNHEMVGATYVNPGPQYGLSEDFLRRDARKAGFDGQSPTIGKIISQFYVNGDIRTFQSVWFRLDEFLVEMFTTYGDFRKPMLPETFVEIAKWKMELISSFYQKFAQRKLIGKPIDAFFLAPE